MDIRQMKINLPEEISKKFIYACMGFGNKEPDVNSLELVKKCSGQILASANSHFFYKEFSMGITDDSKEVYIANENNKLTGHDLAKHLEGCNKCVLMAVTLGPQIDKIIRRAQITDMVEAVALDACASSLIEDLCEQINQQMQEKYKEQGMCLTTRFSPGYGDLPLNAQNVFSNLLEMEKRIGLTQNSEHLLLPRKSITAIIGIFPFGQNKDDGQIENNKDIEKETACEICKRKDQCQFRLRGSYCGKKEW